jgi:protein TonB
VSDRFSSPPASAFGVSRNVLIAGSVVLFHVAALWALQSGLLRRAAEVVIPVEILSEFVEPPKPAEPPPPPPPPPPEVKRQVTRTPPPPRPQAIREPKPAPNAPTGSIAPPPPPALVTAPAPPEPPAAPPAPPAPPSVQLPSSNADYLQNPKPVYPAMSKRLGEQGKTVVRVLIGIDGLPKEASIHTSSGYERLDEAARAAVMGWRYVPGKRNGVVEPMEFNVPINWVLK